jgi:alkylresorcinol/alkylpyrone synthase
MVRLLSLATAVPPYGFAQNDAKLAARSVFAADFVDTDRRLALFDNAGIDRRHLCLPLEEHLRRRGPAEQNRLYLEHATSLLVEVTERCIARAGRRLDEIDQVVCVSSTGVATPSLDALVAERLGLRDDVERTPIFGLGCGGGVLGLSRGAALATAAPGRLVLVLVVELCSMVFRLGDRSKANLVACALFADGAAAALLSTEGEGPTLGPGGEHRWPGSLDVMGWRVEDDGLGVLFSVSVPEIARTRMREPVDRFLARHGLALADVDRWICHPGGAKVLLGLQEALDLPAAALDDSRAVLAAYGNMSSATVMFVLERALRADDWHRGLMLALGPGFTAGFVLVER